jgi:hypothetical protein
MGRSREPHVSDGVFALPSHREHVSEAESGSLSANAQFGYWLFAKRRSRSAVCLQLILKTAMLGFKKNGMKALIKLLVFLALTVSAAAQEPSTTPTPNAVDEPDLPNSKPEIPHPPSTGLLPESGALPNPTPNLTPPIYSPLKTKNTVLPTSTVKPPLRPKNKTEAKNQKRFEEVRSIAMRNPHVASLLKRANNASKASARRSLMRAYYLAVCARMRLLEPELKNSINAYQAEKTGVSVTQSENIKLKAKKGSHGTKRTATHSARHKHAYSHRAVHPSDYEPYEPYGPYPPYGPYGPYGPYAPYGPYGGY